MPRSRSQHGRPLILGRYQGRQTNIGPADFRRFKLELMSRPDRILIRFREWKGFCLMDLPTFLEILRENRQRAIVIARVAAALGIPIGDEALELQAQPSEPANAADADIDDILATMNPGEV